MCNLDLAGGWAGKTLKLFFLTERSHNLIVSDSFCRKIQCIHKLLNIVMQKKKVNSDFRDHPTNRLEGSLKPATQAQSGDYTHSHNV